jgi:Fe-S cluster assembly protein SufD
MTESPQIVTRVRRGEPSFKDFNFTAEMIPPETSAVMQAYRNRSWELYKQLPMPTLKDEPWRRTDIKGLQADTFSLPAQGAFLDQPPIPESWLASVTDVAHGGQVVLYAGGSQVSLSQELANQGVIFTDFLTASRQHAGLVEKLAGKLTPPGASRFAALTSALAQSGVLLYIPKGIQVSQPLHSLLWGAGAGLAHLSHVLVWVDDGASVTYVHETASETETGGQSMHAGLVEILVGEGAKLNFVELQSWGEHIWNFTHERVRVERDGNLDWIFGAIGSHLTKNFSELDLVGPGAVGKMSGFYFTDHDQHLDHDTQQNHLAPNTTSDLLFKGALQAPAVRCGKG